MAERAFMLLGKDNEYSSGVISMVYHENQDITPGIWGAIPLGDTLTTEEVSALEEEAIQGSPAVPRSTGAGYAEVDSSIEELEEVVITAKRKTVSKKNKRIDPESYFEFYIESVSKEVKVDQMTGHISGFISITYSRGSIGRKQNYFRYYDLSTKAEEL